MWKASRAGTASASTCARTSSTWVPISPCRWSASWTRSKHVAYGSLFERLGGETASRARLDHEVAVMASVAAHLAKMLSTRAGSVQTLPDYGLPDLNDMRLSLHDALQQARMAIERFIEQYEPRLKQVRVISLPRTHDPLRQAFAIDAMLELDGLRRQVSFSASLDGSGQVNVNPGASHVR